MKRLIWIPIMAVGMSLALLNGCGEKTEKASQEMKKEVQEASQKATETVKETMATATAWTEDKVDEYLGGMKKQLGNLDTQVEELGTKAESLGGDAKDKFQGQLASLTEKKEAIAMKMEELQGASGEAWGKAKLELEELMTELATIYENMKKDFSAS